MRDHRAADRTLLDRFRGGEAEAFDELVREHQAALLRFATRLSGCPEAAQDVVQETFLRLLRESGSIASSESLRCWLLRVCRNLSTDRQRKEARMQKRHATVAVVDIDNPGPGELEVEETQGAVRSLLDDLPALDREVLLLKVCEGHSYREIAAITGLSLHKVGSAIHRSLRRMSVGLRTAGLA